MQKFISKVTDIHKCKFFFNAGQQVDQHGVWASSHGLRPFAGQAFADQWTQCPRSPHIFFCGPTGRHVRPNPYCPLPSMKHRYFNFGHVVVSDMYPYLILYNTLVIFINEVSNICNIPFNILKHQTKYFIFDYSQHRT